MGRRMIGLEFGLGRGRRGGIYFPLSISLFSGVHGGDLCGDG